MEKCEEGCIYCREIEDEIDWESSIDVFDEKDPKMFVVADDPYCGNEVRINYCPFCGRKLREELLEDLETVY